METVRSTYEWITGISQGDQVQKLIGGFGAYQLFLCLVLFLSKFAIAFHQLAIVFLAPKVSYKCSGAQLSQRETGPVCPCPNPVFNKSVFSRTIVMEWNLICDRKWLISISQTSFQMGTLVGSVLFGMASDRFGRKNPFLAAVVLQLFTGIVAAVVPNYWLFNFFRFLVGVSVGGTMVIGFVIIMEFVGTEHRATVSAIYHTPFNLGHMLLPVFAYFLRDYMHFQLGISVPVVILLSYFCLVPESPRWLIAMRRTEEAIKILERVAKRNNRPTGAIRSTVYSYQARLERQKLKKGSILDLFRTPNIRKNIMAMAYNWLTCSYCFYGVSQYVGYLTGNVFYNVAFSAGFTLLGTLTSIPLMKFLGRKTILILFNLITGVCLMVLAVVPAGVGSVACATVGMVASFIVFVVVYLYCSELFPTVLRNAAIGFSSMMARVGSMIAPFVVELDSIAPWLPPITFAIVPLLGALIALLLPETRNCELMTTIEEAEQFGKKPKSERKR